MGVVAVRTGRRLSGLEPRRLPGSHHPRQPGPTDLVRSGCAAGLGLARGGPLLAAGGLARATRLRPWVPDRFGGEEDRSRRACGRQA